MIRTILAAIATTAAVAFIAAAPAQATPGYYTRGGDVLVTVAVSEGYCATVTWPRGGTSTECDVYQYTQRDIVPGDTFGASIVSYSGGGVACSVLDLETGDVIYTTSAAPGSSANCIRKAN